MLAHLRRYVIQPIRQMPQSAWRYLQHFSRGTVSVALASLQTTLRLLAKRWTALNDELRKLDAQLARPTKKAAPRLLARFGVGPQTAAALLITAGDNPTRLHSETALAALCGSSPLQASSGKIHRHRLNRGGDRQTNNALWTIAMDRTRSGARTRQYALYDAQAKDCRRMRFTAA